MKKFRIPWKPLLVAAGVVSGGAAMAQPYVSVPVDPDISIVFAGAGSPPAGSIGNGGIVCMVDPDVVGGTFGITGVTSPVWKLLGDISVNTTNVPPTPPTITFAGANCGIETYNKFVRTPAETTLPELNSHARSIGRVTINYTVAPCNNTFTFTIYKKWGALPVNNTLPNHYAPPIVGPNCWGTGLITFSVDQVSSDNALDAIGFDQYYWSLTNNAGTDLVFSSPTVSYTSADRSSITFNQSLAAFGTWLAGGAPYRLKCCFGRCNPWNGGTTLTQATIPTTCVDKIINAAATAPTFTTPLPTCLLWSATSFSGVYTSIVGHTYTWTSTCNWVINQVGSVPGPRTVNVTGVDNGPCTLNLTDVGPCGTNLYTYTVNRRFDLSTPMPITTTATCVSPTGSFTVSLPATGNARGNCTNWTISPVPVPAWTFVDANVNLRSVRTYTIPLAACAGSYTITAANCSCAGNSASVQINVRPNAPTALTGPPCVPYNVNAPPLQNYSCTAPCLANGTLTYNWGNTLGMTGSSIINSIGYTPAGTAGGNVTVSASIVAGCTSLTAATIPVNRTPPTPSVIPPCVNVGLAGTATFSVQTPIAGMCYTWNFPVGFCTPTTGTGNSITVSTTGTPLISPGAACSVTANNCAAPFCGPVPFNFNVPVAYTIGTTVTNVPDDPFVAGNQAYSTISATPGCSSYQLWNCAGVGSFVGVAQAGNSFNLNNPGVAGNYSIVATCGACQQRPPCQATLNSHMPLQGGGTVTEQEQLNKRLNGDEGQDIQVMPNPNTGKFQVSITRAFELGSAALFDAQGRRVAQPMRLVQGPNNMDFGDLKPGVYTLRTEVDGKVSSHNVVIADE